MLQHKNYDSHVIDASQYLISLQDIIHDEVQHQFSHPSDRRLHIQLCLNLEFEKSKTCDEPTIIWETTSPVFCSEMQLVMSFNDIAIKLDKSFD